MNNRIIKFGLSAVFLVALLTNLSCVSSVSESFENLLKKSNEVLVQDAATRVDKIYYGQATAAAAFEIYFPLVLPDRTRYISHKITPSSFEGEPGQLVVNYQRNNDDLTIYEGSSNFDDSPITEKSRVDLGDDKPNGLYQKQANGSTYLTWGGGDEGMANDSVVYAIKSEGFSKTEMIGMGKKMALYE